jgi:hypothetical protein
MREDAAMTDPFAAPSGDPAQEPAANPAGALTPPTYGTPPPAYNAPPPYGTPQAPLYGAPAFGSPVQGQKRNGLGTAALVLGIIALFPLTSLLGVLGLIFGIVGRKRVKRGEASNGGVALAGLIISAISLALLALYITLGVLFFTSARGQRYLDCTTAAQNDAAASQRCTDQLLRDFGIDPQSQR